MGGTSYEITWRTSNDPTQVIMGVWIQYSLNGGTDWTTIDYSGPNDFSEMWTVPTTASNQVRVKVIALWGEWYYLDHDESSADNIIITSSATQTVSLIDPNPPVEGGVVVGSGESYLIKWAATGSGDQIRNFTLYLSTNNGASWSFIGAALSTARQYSWTAPAVDTYEAKIRVQLNPVRMVPPKVADTIHAFFIFDTIEFNRPPVAVLGPDMTGDEGESIMLDGSGSYDPDGDTLSYTWTQIEPDFLTAHLVNNFTSRPYFSVELHHFPVNFVFELEVSDGNEHSTGWLYSVERISVTVDPKPPQLLSMVQDTGWPGTTFTLVGEDMMGAEVLFGTQHVHTIPTSPVSGSPNPDIEYRFTLPSTIPTGRMQVSIRTLAGTSTHPGEVEFFPAPEWQYDYGIGFANNATHTLSYPWNPWGEGRMKDCFGDQCYLSLWVCIGIPYWTPWTGWDCLGYLIKEPFCPDPIAAIFYGAFFCWIARNGECFGMSSTALHYYNGDLSIGDFGQSGVTEWSDLVRSGEFREYIDWRQGSQLASQVLNGYLGALLNGLVPSSDVTGMGLFLSAVEDSIDGGELGIITMICGDGAHAVVPYAMEEVDSTHTRIYVYDSNRPQFSDPVTAIDAANRWDEHNDNPPYIEIEKTGVYWHWSFEWTNGNMWDSDVGIAFVPYDRISGGRTMPLSIEGLIQLLAGSADVNVEDTEGNTMGYDNDGELLWEIEDAAPMPAYSGEGDRAKSYYLPDGEYTYHISGTEDGAYNWSCINNGTSAFWIEEAEVKSGSDDTVHLAYEDDNPYRGWMTYQTSDDEKEYTASMVNNYGPRTRVYRIKGAELHDDGEHGMGTNDDYSGIKFTNGGTVPVTFDVEFQTNVVSEEVWNGSSPPESPTLPTASRDGITVQPGETVIIKPTDWLNLDHALVIIEGETVPDIPKDLTVEEAGGQVTLTWTAPDDDGGWPITEYGIFRGESEDVLEFLDTTKEATFTDDAVMKGSTYWYAVFAVNALGTGDNTEAVSIFVPDITSPTEPTNIEATEAKGKVIVTWGPPQDDGGSPVTGYVVLRGTDPVNMTEVATLGVETSYTDTDVEEETTYYYEVKAVNAVGPGTPSDQATVEVPAESTGDGDDDDDGGFPWILAVAIIVVLAAFGAGYFLTGRKRGGPEAMAPMGDPPEPKPVIAGELAEGAAK
jgi:hypothetical protein